MLFVDLMVIEKLDTMKWTFFLICLLSFSSCEYDMKKNRTHLKQTEQENNQIQIIHENNDTIIIIDNRFSNYPFGQNLTEEMLNDLVKPSHVIQKIPWANENLMEMDTFILSTNKIDSIIFYKSSNLFRLNSANIKTTAYTLDKNIQIGISKKRFYELFNISFSNNEGASTIIVKDLEDYSVHSFLFNINGMLENIELYHHID